MNGELPRTVELLTMQTYADYTVVYWGSELRAKRNRQMRVVVSTQTEVPNLDVLETKMDALRGPNLP